MEPTVPSLFVPSLVSLALRSGVAPEPLFASIGRNLLDARAERASFSVREVERLWENLCQRAGAPDLALTLGREVDPEKLGLFGLLLSTSSSPRATFVALSEFKALFHPYLDLAVEEREGWTYMRYQASDGGRIGDKPYYAEVLLSALVHASELYYGCARPPLYASFRHPKPAYLRSYERAFRCELRFGQEVDELCYPWLFLDVPWAGASDSHRALRVEAERRLSQDEQLVVRQVRRVVLARLGSPELGIAEVARALGVSVRSLQRGLQEAGTSYRALRDRLRHERACQLLSQKDATTEAVAQALGYTDRSNFVRAFSRWSGTSPRAWRDMTR